MKFFVSYMKVAESHWLTKLRQLEHHGALWLTCLCGAPKLHSLVCRSLEAAHASMSQKNIHLHNFCFSKQTIGKTMFYPKGLF